MPHNIDIEPLVNVISTDHGEFRATRLYSCDECGAVVDGTKVGWHATWHIELNAARST